VKTGEERRVREKALGVLARPRPGKKSKKVRKKMNRIRLSSPIQVCPVERGRHAVKPCANTPACRRSCFCCQTHQRMLPRVAVVAFARLPVLKLYMSSCLANH
jgi:hypothetical protein